jgi:hypothetical protein
MKTAACSPLPPFSVLPLGLTIARFALFLSAFSRSSHNRLKKGHKAAYTNCARSFKTLEALSGDYSDWERVVIVLLRISYCETMGKEPPRSE